MKKLTIFVCAIFFMVMCFSNAVFARNHHHDQCGNHYGYYEPCNNYHHHNHYNHCDDNRLSPMELILLTQIATSVGQSINSMINPPSNSRTEYHTERINRYENGEMVGSETIEHINSYHINDQYLLHNAR